MATSGTYQMNLARDEIITLAFQHLNVYPNSAAILSGDREYAATMLNLMIKTWDTQDRHLWTLTQGTLFLALDENEYSLGETGDHATSSYVSTTLNANAASGATTLTLVSSSGMTAGKAIGIVLDSGALQWTTISTIPGATSVTIPAPGLTGAATSGNYVYSYNSKIPRPLRIFSARRITSDSLETPLLPLSNQEYFDLSNKTTASTVTSFYYDPQLTNGKMFIWPETSDITDRINFTFARPLQIFDIAANTQDFPSEWLLPISMQLAVLISPRYGKRELIKSFKADADEMLQNLLDFDNEDASVYFQPGQY